MVHLNDIDFVRQYPTRALMLNSRLRLFGELNLDHRGLFILDIILVTQLVKCALEGRLLILRVTLSLCDLLQRRIFISAVIATREVNMLDPVRWVYLMRRVVRCMVTLRDSRSLRGLSLWCLNTKVIRVLGRYYALSVID